MADCNTQADLAARIDELLNPPIHKHPMFDEIGISQSCIWEAADALIGIAAMMRPEINGGDQKEMGNVLGGGAGFRFFWKGIQRGDGGSRGNHSPQRQDC